MFGYYPIHNQQRDLEIWVSRMHRNSLRIAPVSAILPINSTQIQAKSSSDTWSNTNTGAHLKWSPPVSKSPQPETLPDKSCDTEASASKSSVSDMLTLLKTCRLYAEKHGCKTQRTDKTVLPWMINCYKINGTELNNESSMQPNESTSGPLPTELLKNKLELYCRRGLLKVVYI